MTSFLGTFSPDDKGHPSPAPAASNSPSLATLLPNELLLAIFEFARPPSASTGRGWYARLAMVHSSWRDVAKDCLARVVVIRNEDQITSLQEAVRTAGIGGKVREIVFEPLETKECERAPGVRKNVSLSFGQKIAEFLESTGGSVNAVRIRRFGNELLSGFGDKFPPPLPALATFEFSPDYSSDPPGSESIAIFNAVSRNPSLKSFALGSRPHNCRLHPFHNLPGELIEPEVSQAADWILSDSDHSTSPVSTIDAMANLEDVYRASYPDAALLERLQVSKCTFKPTFFIVLTATSFRTITSLAFRRIRIDRDSTGLEHREFFVLLRHVFARQLEEFQWEDRLTQLVEGRTNPSSVPEDALWTFLGQCTKVTKVLSDPLTTG